MNAADVFAQLQQPLLRQARGLTASEEDAEDLVQAAFVRFIERPPEWRGLAKAKNWLNTVMQNLAADRYRAGEE